MTARWGAVLALLVAAPVAGQIRIGGEDLTGGLVREALVAELGALGVAVGDSGVFDLRLFATCGPSPCEPGSWVTVRMDLSEPLTRGVLEWAYRDAFLLEAEHETSFGRLPAYSRTLKGWTGYVRADALRAWLRPILAEIDRECLAPLRATPGAVLVGGWKICPPLSQ